MRTKPDKQYSPNTPKKSNMTLYEMAQSMSENNDAQEAFPYLVNWLFKDFWNNYRYNNIPYDDTYAANLAYFIIYNFINRETGSKVPEVFRTKLLREIVNMNLDADFNAILTDLKNATTDLLRNKNIDNVSSITKTSTTTNNLTDTSAGTIDIDETDTTTHNTTDTTNIQNTISGTNEQVVDTDTTENNTQTLNTNTATTETRSQTDNSTTRQVHVDYPQSTVDTTTTGSWTYASGADDTIVNGTQSQNNNSSTDNTGTIGNNTSGTLDSTTKLTTNQSQTGLSTAAKTGTEQDVKDHTQTTNMTDTHTGTTSTDNNIGTNIDIDVAETWSGMTGVELNSIQLDLINKYGSFYKRLMANIEHCFISVYVDEDRDGWLDPNINLMSAWTIN